MQDDFNYGFQGYIHYWSTKCKIDKNAIVNKEVIASLNKMADILSEGKAFDPTSVSDLYNDVWIEFPTKTGKEKFVAQQTDLRNLFSETSRLMTFLPKTM